MEFSVFGGIFGGKKVAFYRLRIKSIFKRYKQTENLI